MLVEYHIKKGYPSEVDLFIAQTVFQYVFQLVSLWHIILHMYVFDIFNCMRYLAISPLQGRGGERKCVNVNTVNIL